MHRIATRFAALVLLTSTGTLAAGEPPASRWRPFETDGIALVRLSVGDAFDAEAAHPPLAARLAAAAPLSLSACDLDGDGMSDAVAGWAAGDGGLVTVHRGNVDLLWPNTPGARQRRAEGRPVDASFLPDVGLLELETTPDLLGCGHLDGDDLPGLVAAARGATRLELVLGDGRGGVARCLVRELGAPVTALAVGEVNRRDGLDGVVESLTAVDLDGRGWLALVAAGTCRRQVKDGTAYLLFPALQPRLLLRRCEYCGVEVPVVDQVTRCPSCGGAVAVEVVQRSLAAGETFAMDEGEGEP